MLFLTSDSRSLVKLNFFILQPFVRFHSIANLISILFVCHTHIHTSLHLTQSHLILLFSILQIMIWVNTSNRYFVLIVPISLLYLRITGRICRIEWFSSLTYYFVKCIRIFTYGLYMLMVHRQNFHV